MFRLSLTAHAASRGDITSVLGAWLGEPGSGFAIEGIAVSTASGSSQLLPPLVEYQLSYTAALSTPWIAMPHYCGSKGLGLPARAVRFRAAARFADLFDCVYDVTFIDGSSQRQVVGPDLSCLPSGAAIEAISLTLRMREPTGQPAVTASPEADDMPPPPGGESPLDDPTIRLRLLSPAFASAPPRIRNPELIPKPSRQAMGQSWDRKGFKDRTISLRVVENAYVVHEGLALDEALMPIPCTRRLYSDGDLDWARSRILALRHNGEMRRVAGTSLLCKARANNNYGHYLVEMFPKAWIGRHLFGSMGVNYIVQQNDLMLVTAESLVGSGINPNAIAWTSNEPVLCDRLLLLDGVTYHGQYQSPLCAQALQDLAAAIPPGPAERIFVSRHARTRALLNEDRVEEIMRSRGFVVVEPGRMTFREQISLFKGARIVVGALGAALTNIAFCEPGARIVALTSASFPDTFFWFLSLHRQLDYSEIRGADAAGQGGETPWDEGFTMSDDDLAYLATL